ncbi:MAG: hypothetical protein ACREFE_12305 [Limisphaerales bacterium]
MFETLFILPFAFWVVVALLIAGGILAIRHLRDGTGLPVLAVLGTVTAWYIGDVFYNDYANHHAVLFTLHVLQNAWWEVAVFLAAFLLITPWIHRRINARYLRGGSSGVLQLLKAGVDQPVFQKQLNRLFYGCALIWVVLAVIAVIQLQGQVLYFFFPFLGYKASPWNHGRIGVGFDFLSIIAIYIQLLVAGIFGVVMALSTNRWIRSLALFCCLLSWPYFIFDRTRNTILAIVIPAILSWVFLRLRGGAWKKIVALIGFFILVNGWMAFIIQNRSNMTIVAALKEKGFNMDADEKVHHQGLNMYEELCWINTFMEQGTYDPNWGSEYFAELVNPIPRALWHGKPLIGIDYAIARGQGIRDTSGASENGQAGVYATISTGMIGQGVVNFGRILGPAAAALLMSFWVALLARLDLNIQELGRLPLYSLGLILTFNLGRDITLITLYPFVFGVLVVWWLDYRRAKPHDRQSRKIQKPIPRTGLKMRKIMSRPTARRQKPASLQRF